MTAGGDVTATGTASAAGRRRVLFLTDNGHGLGHVTRLLAIARRCPPSLQPVFLTMSTSHRLIADAGFPVEYFPSPVRWGLEGAAWSRLLANKLTHAVQRLRPAVLVIDHVRPSPAMEVLRERFPDLVMVWSRRGLWRAGRNADALDLQPVFDLVVEPIDLAAPIDAGLTPVFTDRVQHVPPITLLDRGDLLPRDDARRELGLDPGRPAALVNLNADDSADLARQIDRAVAVLHRWPGMQVVAPDHALHTGPLAVDERVTLPAVYPLSRYLAAFDLAVVTPGYNSYHEVVMAGLPCVFVPRHTSTVDDQERRAAFAELAGFGWYAASVDDEALAEALEAARDPLARTRVQAAMAKIYPGNGAEAAASAIAAVGAEPSSGSRGNAGLPHSARSDEGQPGGGWVLERVLVVAPSAGADDVRTLLDRQFAEDGRALAPVLLIPADAAPAAEERGLLYETLLSSDDWAALEPSEPYDGYVRARSRELRAVCRPAREFTVPGEEL